MQMPLAFMATLDDTHGPLWVWARLPTCDGLIHSGLTQRVSRSVGAAVLLSLLIIFPALGFMVSHHSNSRTTLSKARGPNASVCSVSSLSQPGLPSTLTVS